MNACQLSVPPARPLHPTCSDSAILLGLGVAPTAGQTQWPSGVWEHGLCPGGSPLPCTGPPPAPRRLSAVDFHASLSVSCWARAVSADGPSGAAETRWSHALGPVSKGSSCWQLHFVSYHFLLEVKIYIETLELKNLLK